MFRFAGFELDQRDELRQPDGVAVKLRPKTSEMLRLFAANPGRVMSKHELMEAIWPNVHVGEDSLFQCIRDIRSALGDDRRQLIKLAAGGGYMLTAEVSVVPTESLLPPEEALPLQPADTSPAMPAETPPPRSIVASYGRAVAAAVALCAIIGLAIVLLWPDRIVTRAAPTVAMIPIVDTSNDPRGAVMAAEITNRLADGFAKIDSISLVTLSSSPAKPVTGDASPASPPDFELRGELQRAGQAWTLRSRIVRTATGEVRSVETVSVDAGDEDMQLQQSRLAAGAGHLLANRLNGLLEAERSPTDADSATSAGDAKVVIEQAIASINQTTPERFGMAQALLKKALADKPDSVTIAVALASLQLRGIQMVWFNPDEAIAAEAEAGATLERALRERPASISALETHCRFLSATNHFLESLVACARVLRHDPWNGGALYLIGLGQINLGRFEDALATFRQADLFDTPSVSRWTWLLGAGWANLLMGRGKDALPWIRRSLAITTASGRSHMLLAAAYQKAGQTEDAKAAIQDGLKLRPGTTLLNVAPPTKNSSPVFVEASNRVIQLMVDAGLPEK